MGSGTGLGKVGTGEEEERRVLALLLPLSLLHHDVRQYGRTPSPCWRGRCIGGHGRTPSYQFTASWKGYGRGEIDWCGVRPYTLSPFHQIMAGGTAVAKLMCAGHGRTLSHLFTTSWQGYGRSEIDGCGTRPYTLSLVHHILAGVRP